MEISISWGQTLDQQNSNCSCSSDGGLEHYSKCSQYVIWAGECKRNREEIYWFYQTIHIEDIIFFDTILLRHSIIFFKKFGFLKNFCCFLQKV